MLTLFYEFALDRDPRRPAPVDRARGRVIGLAVVVLAPARRVPRHVHAARARPRRVAHRRTREEYVAWAWAVNGFFSVIGSVLTTILSMAFGFRAVQFAALAIYAIAVVAFMRLDRKVIHETPTVSIDESERESRVVTAISLS